MKLWKKLLPVALVLLLAVLILPGKAEAATVASGTCGKNLTWTLDDTGTLTISGTGPMKDYFWVEDIPWHASCSSITKVVIEDGVTTIGDYAFHYCTSLTSVTIPDSVTTIGEGAFYECDSLTSVTIPDSVTAIGEYAFYDCESLTDVYYGGSRSQWGTISVGDNNSTLLSATLHYAVQAMPGDVDGNEELDTDDAVYLLLSIMFGTEDYPVPAGTDLDFDGDGDVNTNDAVYLLLHVMFGAEDYPI